LIFDVLMTNDIDYQLPQIQNQSLLELALTHRSYANENPELPGHNERLEFLGDAILGFLVGELLYRDYPQMSEAELTRLRSRLVDEEQLGKLGALMKLGELMRLGNGAAKDNGRTNPSLLNDTFEAIIGAYFLDQGIEVVAAYVQPLFKSLAEQLVNEQSNFPTTTFIDSKNKFQQWALANYQKPPTYKIIKESGPDHAKEFTAQVLVQGVVYGTGQGKRKQEAQKAAAEAALEKIDS